MSMIDICLIPTRAFIPSLRLSFPADAEIDAVLTQKCTLKQGISLPIHL